MFMAIRAEGKSLGGSRREGVAGRWRRSGNTGGKRRNFSEITHFTQVVVHEI